MVVKLKLPPGIVSNGTDYAGAGKWIDCNLMRWDRGILKTVGGWQDFATSPVDPAQEAVRAVGCITSLAGAVSTFFGSNDAVYKMTTSGTFTDITPAEFTSQAKDAVTDSGYGMSLYGRQTYGTPRISSGAAPGGVFSWAFGAWGETLLALPRALQLGLFQYRQSDNVLTPITGSPAGGYDFAVTDERMVMVIGKDTDHRLVSWCDQEDYNEWLPAVTNTAGSYRLSGTGHLLACRKIQNQVLILGVNDAFAAQYIGPPYVYGFTRVGDKCGVVSPTALATISTSIFWFGNNSFWQYDGALRPLNCPVLEHVLSDIDDNQRSKMFAFANTDFNEIWWLYQSTASNECDKYVAYNYADNLWYVGSLDRTCGTNASELKYLTLFGSDGIVYNHEVPSAGFSGMTPYIQSGPLETQNGSRLFGMSYVFPDDTAGLVNMEVQVRDMPKNPPLRTVTYALTSPTSTMGVMGRDLRLKLSSAVANEGWTLGDMRVEPVKVTGMR